MAPAAVVAAVATVTMVAALSPSIVPGPGATPASTAGIARPFLLDAERLRTNALLAEAGVEPWARQARALFRAAERALVCDPDSAPGGSGTFQAAARTLGVASRCAYVLAIAATVGGDPRFVRRAAELALAWAEADPCLLWGRGCDAGSRPMEDPGPTPEDTALLDAALAELVLAADLTRRRGGLPGADADRFAGWLVRLAPSGTPPPGPEGDLDVVLRMAIAGFTGDTPGRQAAAAEWRRRLSLLRPDGRLTDGAGRVVDLERAQRALGLRLLAATIAGPERREMLDATGPDGIRLRDAVEALAAGMTEPSSWPDVSAPAPAAVWELAYALWGTSDVRPLVAELRERGGEGSPPLRWPSLVFGLADARVARSPSPAGSPTDREPATEAPESTRTPAAAAGVPNVRLGQGSVVDGTVPVIVSWATATGLPGGDVSYRVQLRRDGGQWTDVATTDRTSLITRLPVGPRFELRLRAAASGSSSTHWVAGEPFALARIEAAEATLDPPSAWMPASNPGYSGRSLVYAERPGARITFTVEGRAIGLRVPVGPTRGEARVTIDGGPATVVDEYARRFAPAVVLFVAQWEVPGRHEVAIEVVGTPGRETVSIDALVVLR